MSDVAARAAQVDKMKTQMMQVMGITDPSEFQRIARDYCKEMAVEMALPFYHRLYSRLSKLMDKTRDKFDKLGREEKVAYTLKLAMDDNEVVETFKQAFDEPDSEMAGKSVQLSVEKRNAGNAAFQKKKDGEALTLYTEAVFSAPAGEEGKRDISLGLANRSAVLIKMKKYKECLEDIDAALYFEYPDNIRYKLVDRQAKCFAALGNVSEAVRCYNRVILLLKQSNLDTDKQKTWRQEVDAELEVLKTRKQEEVQRENSENRFLVDNVNKRIPQFSSAVELVFNEQVGRHGRATR
ncbi:SET and MYND domain-containing protein 4 [Eurytemora carolleeae]|uniref:SET and MYND domain-containing protein 4 n=1 Tax=Eurytemora carolleeae TaxID=1294199 RepID=UPI000C79451E|nr:SET and MYND domain-containing protein 4 [Eurytemora carolleeae]|eukprot:XP_023327508.1 SET and MYND domain-containing protein 4-like [Eurytemora affinis]